MSKIYFSIYIRKTMEVVGYTDDEQIALNWLEHGGTDENDLPIFDYQWHEEEV